MGMSTHVVGFKPPNGKWEKMKSVWDACRVAGISPPDEVLEFFDHKEPDPAGVEVDEADLPLTPWGDENGQGFELDVSELDPNIKIIRFYNSW